MARELGPDEGINRLQHPDCRACKERERLNIGLLAENLQLKKKLGKKGGDDALEAVALAPVAAEGGSVQCDGVALPQLLSAIKVWRNATESRLRMLNRREALDTMIPADRQLIEAAQSVESELEIQQSSGGQEHDYLSTACLHGLHDRCRLTCKFCEVACSCRCHFGGQEGGVEAGAIEKLTAAVTRLQAKMYLTGSPPKDQDEALSELAALVDALGGKAR